LEGRASAVRRWARSSYASSPPWPRMSHRRRRVGHFVVIGATSSCVSLASLACRSVLLCLSSSSPPSPHALHRLTSCPSSPSPAHRVAVAMRPSSLSPCSLVAVALVPSSQSPWSPRHRRPGPLAPSPRVAFGPCASLATLVPVLAVFWTRWSLRAQYIMEISVRPPHSNLLPMFSSVDSNPHSESTRDLGSATTSTATSTSTYGGGLPGSFGEHPI
jgi:hypothetical protein